MTTHGIASHFPEFFERIALGGDGMTERSGDEATVHLILTHFKDDFIHLGNIARANDGGQGAILRNSHLTSSVPTRLVMGRAESGKVLRSAEIAIRRHLVA